MTVELLNLVVPSREAHDKSPDIDAHMFGNVSAQNTAKLKMNEWNAEAPLRGSAWAFGSTNLYARNRIAEGST